MLVCFGILSYCCGYLLLQLKVFVLYCLPFEDELSGCLSACGLLASGVGISNRQMWGGHTLDLS